MGGGDADSVLPQRSNGRYIAVSKRWVLDHRLNRELRERNHCIVEFDGALHSYHCPAVQILQFRNNGSSQQYLQYTGSTRTSIPRSQPCNEPYSFNCRKLGNAKMDPRGVKRTKLALHYLRRERKSDRRPVNIIRSYVDVLDARNIQHYNTRKRAGFSVRVWCRWIGRSGRLCVEHVLCQQQYHDYYECRTGRSGRRE